jgi:K(+)-stimulated pyrophosphate-energized sodium pump
MFAGKKDFDFEAPLTNLVWIPLAVFHRSHLHCEQNAARRLQGRRRGITQPSPLWVLSVIISCGTVAGAGHSRIHQDICQHHCKHFREVTNCSKHGGASLNILSGLSPAISPPSGLGLCIMVLMAKLVSIFRRTLGCSRSCREVSIRRPDLRFGLGGVSAFSGMGPVTIALNSYGPVTGQRAIGFELSQIEGPQDNQRESNVTWLRRSILKTPNTISQKATVPANFQG